jgi:O-antigen/teichoic acid export membrane protein
VSDLYAEVDCGELGPVDQKLASIEVADTEVHIGPDLPPVLERKRAHGARSVFYSGSAKFLIVALNAGTGILTARTLHPAGRGELAAILLWPQVLSGALALGLPSALTYNIRLRPSKTPSFLLAAITLGFIIGSLATCGAIVLAPHLLRQYRPEIVFVAQCLMPNLIVGIYLLLGRAALEADHSFGQSGMVLITPPSLTLAGLSVLALLHHLTPVSAGITYILSGIPAVIFLYTRLPFSLWQPFREVLSASKLLLSYGIRSYGIDLCGTLGYYIDQALVVSLLSPEKMGVYVVALSASRVMNVPQQALASVLFPSMVGRSRQEIASLIERSLRIGGTLAIFSSVVTFVCGRTLLRLVYGRAFAEVGGLLGILTVEAALSGCVSIIAQAFMASNRPGIITKQQILGLSCGVPCLLILIPRFGVSGAATSILISTGVRFTFAAYSFRKEFSGRMPTLLLDQESFVWLKDRLRSSLKTSRSTGGVK